MTEQLKKLETKINDVEKDIVEIKVDRFHEKSNSARIEKNISTISEQVLEINKGMIEQQATSKAIVKTMAFLGLGLAGTIASFGMIINLIMKMN